MTTNKIEDLDEALIRYFFFGYSKEMSCLMNQFYRDGRIDKQIHLGYATKEQIAGLFAHFYSLDICATIVKEFTEQLRTYGVSMANLQVCFLSRSSSARGVLKKTQNKSKKPKTNQKNQKTTKKNTIMITRYFCFVLLFAEEFCRGIL